MQAFLPEDKYRLNYRYWVPFLLPWLSPVPLSNYTQPCLTVDI